MTLDHAAMDATDFVMKRKRKRRAIDPCLGFYSESSTPEIPKLLSLEKNERNSADLISDPPLASTPPHPDNVAHNDSSTSEAMAQTSDSSFSTPSAQSSDPVPLSVESFLQRNSKRIRVKKYGRRNKRIVESSSPLVSNGTDNKPNDQRPSKSAAKLSDILSRPPLPFVPLRTRGTAERKRRLLRPWSTAEPNKGVPFRSASFSLQDNKPGASPEYRTLSQWQTVVESVQESQRATVNKRLKVMSSTLEKKELVFCCPPLRFVSLADAERAYTAKSQTNSKAKREKASAGGILTTAPPPLFLSPTLASNQAPLSSDPGEVSLSNAQSHVLSNPFC
ncbi:hypothetical protein LshimejAT787_0802740 [Lyophyllum shimeji]|uniref:Uncharacterized protein n=1 Tax=Lyophyllum shimeji TaxID=47721 RepID=A0A9P3UP80_LYOSH|nr:hypothetical protein LshimejAT787_0802740 [Lyophyllum shimeji]